VFRSICHSESSNVRDHQTALRWCSRAQLSYLYSPTIQFATQHPLPVVYLSKNESSFHHRTFTLECPTSTSSSDGLSPTRQPQIQLNPHKMSNLLFVSTPPPTPLLGHPPFTLLIRYTVPPKQTMLSLPHQRLDQRHRSRVPVVCRV
jgi:hypothetical protein